MPPCPIPSTSRFSGGGQNGAFGAGVLCGWTASGQRPTFRIVTGISTGALIAPFAFLGAEYDPEPDHRALGIHVGSRRRRRASGCPLAAMPRTSDARLRPASMSRGVEEGLPSRRIPGTGTRRPLAARLRCPIGGFR